MDDTSVNGIVHFLTARADQHNTNTYSTQILVDVADIGMGRLRRLGHSRDRPPGTASAAGRRDYIVLKETDLVRVDPIL